MDYGIRLYPVETLGQEEVAAASSARRLGVLVLHDPEQPLSSWLKVKGN